MLEASPVAPSPKKRKQDEAAPVRRLHHLLKRLSLAVEQELCPEQPRSVHGGGIPDGRLRVMKCRSIWMGRGAF